MCPQAVFSHARSQISSSLPNVCSIQDLKNHEDYRDQFDAELIQPFQEISTGKSVSQ